MDWIATRDPGHAQETVYDLDFARLTSIRLRTATLVGWKLAPKMYDLIEMAG